MEFDKIKNLMESLENSNIMDFELKLNDGFYLRMNKFSSPSTNNKGIAEEQQPKEIYIDKATEIKEEKQTQKIETKQEEIKGGELIKSPIVGTFYGSSSPTKPDFIKVGDKVKKGDILCIIEAMKVMNEITSAYEGEIVEILVGNEDMVEYNQPLFRIV